MNGHGVYNTFQNGPSGSQTSSEPYEPDIFRGNIGKPSGKASAYMMWLNEEGRHQFRNKYGREYHHSPLNRDKIDVIYQTVPQEKRDWYKERERVANSNKEEVAHRRHTQSSKNRDYKHRDPFRYQEKKIQHERTLEQLQQEDRNKLGPIQMPLAMNDYQPNVARLQDVFYMRVKHLAEMQRIFAVRLQSFGTSSILDRQFQFLGALSYCNMRLGDHIYAYPAELAVVSFTLRGGITEWDSRIVAFDPEYFYTEREAQVNPTVYRLRETIIKDAQEAKRKYSLPGGGLSLCEAREWFKSKRNVKALMLCDGNNWAEVASSMLTVAISQTHVVATADHSDIISTVAIQDVAEAIAKATKSSATHDGVDDHFKLVRQARDHFCDVHGGLRLDDTRRHTCQLAQAVVHLQLLFDFLRDYELVEFGKHYNHDVHNFCYESAGRSMPMYDVPPPLSQLNINGADQAHFSEPRASPQPNFNDENNRSSDLTQGSRFSAPGRVQGDGQMPTHSRVNEENGQRVAVDPPIARLGSSVVHKSSSHNKSNDTRRSSRSPQSSSSSSTFKFNWTAYSEDEISALRNSNRPQKEYKGRFLDYKFKEN